MNGNEADFAHLTELSRIACSEEEKKVLGENLKKILNYMALLDELDTKDVTPCTHILESMINVMGEDEEKPCLDREDFLKGAPDQVGGMIKVPPIIKFEE